MDAAVSGIVALGPPVDVGRVEAARARIGAGGYHVDPEAIAGAMFAFAGRDL